MHSKKKVFALYGKYFKNESSLKVSFFFKIMMICRNMKFMIKYLYGATLTDNANEEVSRHEVN